MYFCTIIYKYIKMNYEDLLESMNGAALAKEVMPFGQFYKKMTDGKSFANGYRDLEGRLLA